MTVEVKAEMVGKVWTMGGDIGGPVVGPSAGTVEAIHVAIDDVVNPGDQLVTIV